MYANVEIYNVEQRQINLVYFNVDINNIRQRRNNAVIFNVKSSVKCSDLGQPAKISSKKISTIPLYTHFWKFIAIFNHKKSTIGIY